ncbi:phage terminase large subunit, partial [Desulfovibrio inopinatus]|uniref:phage terminase large subunit n=1 Tax=Desulfovibrio inopinatus TaxID=102109 RepID=UPI00068598B4
MYFDEEIAKFHPRQLDAVQALDRSNVKYLLYGGALGGGKSYFLRWVTVRRLMAIYKRYNAAGMQAMIACEDYPTLKDRQLSKIATEFPPWLGKYYSNHKTYGHAFLLKPKWGGGVIVFRNLDNPAKYASAEFVLICVDELTKNTYDTFTHLRSRLRWAGIPDHECKFAAGTNPGSIGHSWCKQLWIDSDFPDEWKAPVDYTQSFCYIPAKADDNPHLDEAYYGLLQTLPPALRKAFRDGDWDVFQGQAFHFSKQRHVIDPIPVPDGAPIYMTMDWGYGAPFSVGWWWVDNDGRVYRFGEWYGWTGTANQGLRLTDAQLADGIKYRERKLGITDRPIVRLAGPDCFNRKPNYMGGGQGPSTADVFAQHDLHLRPGDPSRHLKIRQFHERLSIPDDDTMPMLVIYSTCEQFVRTIPTLVIDPSNPEDIDEKGAEDHIYDESCHVLMARPLNTAMSFEDVNKSQRNG